MPFRSSCQPRANHCPPFIAAHSAIVGREPDGGRVGVYYEGNIYDYPGMVRFADRVATAAGRLVERYPTVARAKVPESDLARIGYWDNEVGLVVLDEPGAQAALAAYLETAVLDPDELMGISSSRWQIRREFETAHASADLAVRFAATWYERHIAHR